MLSIIIPTLNEEKNLDLLLKEIKKQKFDDYEIVVADADSKDKTKEVARKYGCRIVKGGLPAQGRNNGAKLAKGDIYLFLDADIFYLPKNFFKKALKEFNDRKLGIAAFRVYPAKKSSISNELNKIDKIAYGIYNKWIELSQEFTAYGAHSILVRKNVFKKISGFNEEIKIAEDHDFAKRAYKISKFGFICNEPMLTSNRRFEKDGRFNTYSKFFLVATCMFLFGPVKSDIFKYKFGYKKKKS